MIHIDDLVRQRLAGGEDERPAAWLQMRELLDDKMPVSAPGGMVNWRRMLSYTAAILLLSAISLGGYQMLSSHRDATGNDGNTAIASSSARGTHNTARPASSPANNSSSQNAGTNKNAALFAANTSNNDNSSNNNNNDKNNQGTHSNTHTQTHNVALGANTAGCKTRYRKYIRPGAVA